MNLVVDVGNTRIKSAVFEKDNLIERFVFDKKNIFESLENIFEKFEKIEHLVVASVGDLDKKGFLSFSHRVKINFITHKNHFPFVNTYETPTTVGIDRLVLAAGATLFYPNEARLVIDAGTCITYDFVNDKNEYLGGAISPGIKMRYQALEYYTAKLPLLALEAPRALLGNSTNQSIHSGVVNGIVGEIEGFITRLQSDYEKFTIILTGGDADFLAKRLKNTIFANSNFLLESLNQLFLYNIKND